MGRKVDMKKIEDITKCQVTFSKRRSSLMKKAHEISVCCDVDVAFVTFSPSGRVIKFSSQKRIEDVIDRYINLTVDRRYKYTMIPTEKQEKLYQLDHIKGDTSKLQYLDKQDYEPLPEQEPSLHQLLWCERNLKQSLEKVKARKNGLMGSYPSSQSLQPNAHVEMESQGSTQLPCNLDGRSPSWLHAENPCNGKLLMQLDPWISPYSAKVRESIFQGLVDKAKRAPAGASAHHKYDFPATIQSGISFAVRESQVPPPMQILHPISNPSSLTLLDYRGGALDKNIGNFINMAIKWSIASSVHGSYFTPPASSAAAITASRKELNLDGLGLQQAGQIGLEQCQHKNDQKIIRTESKWLNPTPSPPRLQHNITGENIASVSVNEDQLYSPDMAVEKVDPPRKAPEAALLDSLIPLEDILDDKKFWTHGIQESGLWEWDDLVMVDNLNLEDLENFC
ncbi:K-box region and MADS-box transcription factor family protein [Actinidia rufa]|uniref:K-box region and MADS-box transcription factor family protein n=1 Tax=Actinidia rufa TaxID=165716 RepID=A0A7J0H6B6_9ERIC|nr:K-box region and MADS-box transcription factor family protein [Actinidia rufa]